MEARGWTYIEEDIVWERNSVLQNGQSVFVKFNPESWREEAY